MGLSLERFFSYGLELGNGLCAVFIAMSDGFAKSSHFGNQFDFDAAAHRQLCDPKGAACVGAFFAKNLANQGAATVGYQMLFGEATGRVDQAHDFDNALDCVQIAHGGMQGAHQVNGHSACCQLGFGGGHVEPQLTHPWFAVFFGDVTAQKNQVTGLHKRHIRCSRLSHWGQDDVQFRQAVVNVHGSSLQFKGLHCNANFKGVRSDAQQNATQRLHSTGQLGRSKLTVNTKQKTRQHQDAVHRETNLIFAAKRSEQRGAWRVMLVGWIAGTAVQLQQSTLWPLHELAVAACCCAVGILALIRWPLTLKGSVWISGIGLMLLSASMAWSLVGLRAHMMLSDPMPSALEGRNLDVVGVVLAMPQRSESGLRFRFSIESALMNGQAVRVPQQVYLAWYGGAVSGVDGINAERTVAALQAGERWQWRVRLKAPHGHMNPGGFDYELWLWEQGLQATGYVRTGAHDPAPVRLTQTYLHPIEWARQSVRDAIVARFAMGQDGEAEAKLAGVVAALVTGDQSAIDRSDWDVFRATGVAHLMSISGLHITLFAWLAAGLVGGLWRRSALWGWHWCLHWPAPQAALVGGVVLAAAYALFSGWGVPAQRTVWMLAMVGVLRLSGRIWPWPWIWTLALAVVIIFDPWALYQAGFWLSFIAVGVLFATSSPVMNSPEVVHEPVRYRAWRQWTHQFRWLEKFWSLMREQWVVTWALTPLSVLFFGQISVVGLLANLLAIPWVTLVVTPLAMGGVLWPGLWSLAVLALQPLQLMLAVMASWSWATAYVALPPLGLALTALSGGLLMAMPWPWKVRCLGIPLLLPALAWQVPRPLPGHFELLALDLGQGNAVLVRTAQHSLLYDTGPRYSVESDAGHRVVVPLLRRWNERLNTLLLSHRDSDHTGGAAAVMAMQPSASLLSSLEWGHPLLGSSMPLRANSKEPIRCSAGQSWTWDGVTFEVLHPLPQNYVQGARSNSLSCVLRISNARHTALLVGDIEAPQELALVNRAKGTDGLVPSLKADVLLVPHHGSKTSSTASFIDAVSPRWAWVQAGYRNRFGHPAAEVVARYQMRNIEVVDSAHCGAMQWRSNQAGVMQCERTTARRYWHHNAP